MIISFLGTGTIIPDPKFKSKRSYSAILVEIDKAKILFDIGPGTLTKMQSIGFNTQIFPDYLFITHFHIDHCLDYIALVKSRNFNTKTGNAEKGKLLEIFGPKGLKKWTKEIFSIEKWKYMKNQLDYTKVINLNEVQNGLAIKKRNWKVTCCPINHDKGIAFRIDHFQKSFVYSGDMQYDERLCALGKDADLVALECSFPDKKSLKGKHLEPTSIIKLAKLGGFRKLVLTHMYPPVYGREKEIVKKIQDCTHIPVIISDDFKKIVL